MVARRAIVPASLLALLIVAGACGDGGSGTEGDAVARGEALFASNCVACHGEQAMGTTAGPPLVHEIYEPGHHSDASFQRAVQEGVPQHHWDFGPMPALPGLSEEQVDDITAYVRELQRDAGIID